MVDWTQFSLMLPLSSSKWCIDYLIGRVYLPIFLLPFLTSTCLQPKNISASEKLIFPNLVHDSEIHCLCNGSLLNRVLRKDNLSHQSKKWQIQKINSDQSKLQPECSGPSYWAARVHSYYHLLLNIVLIDFCRQKLDGKKLDGKKLDRFVATLFTGCGLAFWEMFTRLL